jgi:hypothetical protein
MGDGTFTLVDYATGAIIAQNISRDQFGQYSDNITDLPAGVGCGDDSRCKPICGSIYNQNEPPPVPLCCTLSWSPGQNTWLVHCQAVDERGINQGFEGKIDELDRAKWDALCAYVPPGGCRAGLAMIAGQCSTGAIACGDRLVEIDENSQPTGRILSESWSREHAYEQLPLGVHAVNESDPRCQTPSPTPTPTPTPGPTPTPTPTPIPAPTPTPGPAPTPGPVSVTPPSQVTPGTSVPIRTTPVSAPAAPPPLRVAPGAAPVPSLPPAFVPNKSFSPPSRPMCQSTPYKTRMFSQTTRATRPDQFVEKDQWTT